MAYQAGADVMKTSTSTYALALSFTKKKEIDQIAHHRDICQTDQLKVFTAEILPKEECLQTQNVRCSREYLLHLLILTKGKKNNYVRMII